METIDDDSSLRSNVLDVISQHFIIRIVEEKLDNVLLVINSIDILNDWWPSKLLPEWISFEELVDIFGC